MSKIEHCDMCKKRVNNSMFSDAESYLIHPDGNRHSSEFIDLCFECQKKVYEFIKKTDKSLTKEE